MQLPYLAACFQTYIVVYRWTSALRLISTCIPLITVVGLAPCKFVCCSCNCHIFCWQHVHIIYIYTYMIIYVLMYIIWYIHSLFLVLQTDASLTCIHRYGTMAPESRARHSERWKHEKLKTLWHFPSEYVWIFLGLPWFTMVYPSLPSYPSKKW